MSFINAKHWPTLPPHIFPKQYERLGLSEPEGLWFRAVGESPLGGAVVMEVWQDHLSWRGHREAEAVRRDVSEAKAAHKAPKPGATLRTEATAHYFPAEGPRSAWRAPDVPGALLAVTYPDIPVEKYISGLDKHGQTTETAAGQGVLCSVDGPSGDADWTVLRVWTELAEHADAIAKQMADLRKPAKSRACLEGQLTHVYVTALCPRGSSNPFGNGRFL